MDKPVQVLGFERMDDLVPGGVGDFDTASAPVALDAVSPACASPAWRDALVAGRPYGTLERLVAASDTVIAGLPWVEIEAALAAHPRIGERATGTEREAAWSREEQAGAAGAEGDALRARNVAYEARFGHVFLICATGRSSEEMLAALGERLSNDPAAERDVVRRELAAISRLRLARVLA